MLKWIWDDGVETHIFATNPYVMTSPYQDNPIVAHSTNATGVNAIVTRDPLPAKEWTFTGNIYTDTEYLALKAWHEKNTSLTITDHLGRSYVVISVKFDVTSRQTTLRSSTRRKYTWTVRTLRLA